MRNTWTVLIVFWLVVIVIGSCSSASDGVSDPLALTALPSMVGVDYAK